jgi:hypothetical protein
MISASEIGDSRRTVMMRLTDEQRKLILLLGSGNDTGAMSMKTHQELVDLGLLYSRNDGVWDLTDDGEKVYDQLSGWRDGW